MAQKQVTEGGPERGQRVAVSALPGDRRAGMREGIVEPCDRPGIGIGGGTGDQQDGRRSGRVHDADTRLQAEVLDGGPHAGPGDGEDGNRTVRRETRDPGSQAHSNARSRQAYRTPSNRMTMNMAISTIAMIPSDRNTTAHGYMNTISMSKARKTRAIG